MNAECIAEKSHQFFELYLDITSNKKAYHLNYFAENWNFNCLHQFLENEAKPGNLAKDHQIRIAGSDPCKLFTSY